MDGTGCQLLTLLSLFCAELTGKPANLRSHKRLLVLRHSRLSSNLMTSSTVDMHRLNVVLRFDQHGVTKYWLAVFNRAGKWLTQL